MKQHQRFVKYIREIHNNFNFSFSYLFVFALWSSQKELLKYCQSNTESENSYEEEFGKQFSEFISPPSSSNESIDEIE
jgi:hypothetical protein